MIIDHIGAVILQKFYTYNIHKIYILCRFIGRISFPIFAFCLVEGFIYTSNRKKYFIRLLIFALISEVPYDLALNNSIFELRNQNILFTFTLALLELIILDKINIKRNHTNIKIILFNLIIIIFFMIVTDIINCDYSFIAILIITITYFFYKKRNCAMLIDSLILILWDNIEITTLLSCFFIYLYNGKQGNNKKAFYYLFYPIHLFILFIISKYIFIV